jgi:hypothetical protein
MERTVHKSLGHACSIDPSGIGESVIYYRTVVLLPRTSSGWVNYDEWY